ncbi:MAG: DUF7475 family protein [Ardenticatenaceae bacterium]
MKATTHLGPLQWAIILLTLATAIIHFALAIPKFGFFDILFYLNGLGYLVLLADLYFIPQLANYRALVRALFIAYTLLTIVLFFIMNSTYGPVGLATKAIEALLLVLLVRQSPK